MKTTSTLERKTALRIVKVLNLVMMTMSFAFIWYTFYAKNIRSPFYNKGNWLVIAIFTITAIVVYLVRRLEVDHAWTLAIISGVLIEVVGLFVGYLVLNVSGKTLGLLIGNILSLLILTVII